MCDRVLAACRATVKVVQVETSYTSTSNTTVILDLIYVLVIPIYLRNNSLRFFVNLKLFLQIPTQARTALFKIKIGSEHVKAI